MTTKKTTKTTTKKSALKTRGATTRPVGGGTGDRGDWRGQLLSRLRALIEKADPGMIEERKWKKPSNGMAGVPVWSHDGIVCTGETYKNAVKMTFAKGAALEDPAGLFNSSLAGNARRAIDFHEGDAIDERALKALIKAAVKLNAADRDERTR